jgi:aspartyl-tRNA(Asn)/glutamyl-tRNA(Gln) amidotransferase subunit B
MEEGSMRADVNVSVRKVGGELGTRTETKNVNSVRFVMAVVEHEAKRQVAVLEAGGGIVQETRLFDPDKGETRTLRSKEDAHDYRYFPDPDLLPLELDEEFLAECKASLPELPDAKRKRYEGLGLSTYTASILTAEIELADYFDRSLADAVTTLGKPERELASSIANWITNVVAAEAKVRNLLINAENFDPTANTAVVELISSKTVSTSAAKTVFTYSLDNKTDIPTALEKTGLKQTSDTGAIDAAVDAVLAANADKVAEYRAGKQALFGFFVGQVMKAMQGKANPGVVNERLRGKLDA